jgi:hypothetical protein
MKLRDIKVEGASGVEKYGKVRGQPGIARGAVE